MFHAIAPIPRASSPVYRNFLVPWNVAPVFRGFRNSTVDAESDRGEGEGWEREMV